MVALPVTRYVWQVAALAMMTTERVAELIAPTAQRHLNGFAAAEKVAIAVPRSSGWRARWPTPLFEVADRVVSRRGPAR